MEFSDRFIYDYMLGGCINRECWSGRIYNEKAIVNFVNKLADTFRQLAVKIIQQDEYVVNCKK